MRHAVSLVVLIVAVAAFNCSEPSQDELRATAESAKFLTLESCSVDEERCRDVLHATIEAGRSTPVPIDPRTREIFFEDPTIRSITAGRVEGRDYWVRLGATGNPGHGDRPGELAAAEIVFTEPVSWDGMVSTASQPCAGKGDEGRVPTEHPCQLVEREFGQEFRSYVEVRELHGAVFLRQQLVANLFGSTPNPSILESMIESISSSYE